MIVIDSDSVSIGIEHDADAALFVPLGCLVGNHVSKDSVEGNVPTLTEVDLSTLVEVDLSALIALIALIAVVAIFVEPVIATTL